MGYSESRTKIKVINTHIKKVCSQNNIPLPLKELEKEQTQSKASRK